MIVTTETCSYIWVSLRWTAPLLLSLIDDFFFAIYLNVIAQSGPNLWIYSGKKQNWQNLSRHANSRDDLQRSDSVFRVQTQTCSPDRDNGAAVLSPSCFIMSSANTLEHPSRNTSHFMLGLNTIFFKTKSGCFKHEHKQQTGCANKKILYNVVIANIQGRISRISAKST